MRYLLAMMLLAGTASAQTANKAIPLPKVGDRAKVFALFEGSVPAAKTAEAYDDFIAAVRAQQGQRILKAIPESVALLRSGIDVQVISVLSEGKEMSYAGQKFPANVPAVVVKPVVDGKVSETQYWVPLLYFGDFRNEPHPAEIKFPIVEAYPDVSVVPEPGMTMFAFSVEGDILMAKGLFQYERLIKAQLANDQKGIEELIQKKEIAVLDSMTEVLVIERHNNQFIGKNTHPVEARILGGPYKGQTCWFPEQFTFKFVPKLTSYKDAAAAVKSKAGPASKPKAKRRTRRGGPSDEGDAAGDF